LKFEKVTKTVQYFGFLKKLEISGQAGKVNSFGLFIQIILHHKEVPSPSLNHASINFMVFHHTNMHQPSYVASAHTL
jgi:hypothetical protein